MSVCGCVYVVVSMLRDMICYCTHRTPVTEDVLTTWYQERAREIEQCSGQVGLGTGHDIIDDIMTTN